MLLQAPERRRSLRRIGLTCLQKSAQKSIGFSGRGRILEFQAVEMLGEQGEGPGAVADGHDDGPLSVGHTDRDVRPYLSEPGDRLPDVQYDAQANPRGM